MKHPFHQKKIKGRIVREFDADVDSNELVWHRDHADRYVKVRHGHGWQLQMENSLPIPLVKGKTYYIPKNSYHRVLKGDERLVVEIREEMKVTKQQLRQIIKEESASLINEINWEQLASEMDVDPQITKVGHLRKIIKTLQSDKRTKLGIEGLKDLGIGALADIIPGAGTALSLGQTLKSMYSAPDDKKTNTMLDKLNVDDEVAAIVDDTVEDNFLNVALDALEGLDDNDPIPDINQELASWLRSKYDARTVDGFQEGKRIKVSKQQLRKIIREAISLDIEKDDIILTGKFKNKRSVVKDIGTDKNGHPTINGKSILKFKIEKLLPEDEWSKKSQEALEFIEQID